MYVTSYFFGSIEAKYAFETNITGLTEVDFIGTILHFLVIDLSWNRNSDINLEAQLSQQTFVEQMIAISYRTKVISIPKLTPYISGHKIDSIPYINIPTEERDKLITEMR